MGKILKKRDSNELIFHIRTSFSILNLLIHLPGFPDPFTSSLPFVIPMGLLLHSLNFLGPFTPSLPLFILMGLLGLLPYSLTIFRFPPFLYYWASSTIGPFVKSGHQQWANNYWVVLPLNLKCCFVQKFVYNTHSAERTKTSSLNHIKSY